MGHFQFNGWCLEIADNLLTNNETVNSRLDKIKKTCLIVGQTNNFRYIFMVLY